MAVTIDPRPTYFGDRMIVTGSYTGGTTSIDLSSLLSKIDFANVIPTGETALAISPSDDGSDADTIGGVQIADQCTFSGTTITVLKSGGAGAGTQPGTFFVIGRR
tara:strand:+ start:2381 stop:2695 length:315 start_codon:yes stop_codon:yes gene_type:complete